MSRDILAVRDAISRARGVSKGMEALVGLLQGNEESNPRSAVPLGDVAELLWSVQRDLDGFLAEAERRLKA